MCVCVRVCVIIIKMLPEREWMAEWVRRCVGAGCRERGSQEGKKQVLANEDFHFM